MNRNVKSTEMPHCRIDCYDQFEDCRDIWQDFQSTAHGYLFQHYEWQKHWFDKIGYLTGGEPRIVVVRDVDDGVLVLWPLWLVRSFGIGILQWSGGVVTDYGAPLVASSVGEWSDKQFANVWGEVLQCLNKVDAIRLQHQPTKILDLANPCRAMFGRQQSHSYFATLGSDWMSFYTAQVSKRIRADSRRQRKRLAEQGEVRFLVATETGEVNRITESMIRHKQRRYEETAVVDVFLKPGYREFYLDLPEIWRRNSQTNVVHVCALYVDDVIVATHWGLRCSNRFYFLMPTYEGGDWRRFSVGRVLLEELMQWCIAEGVEVFDFSIGEEAYKREWCSGEVELFETVVAKTWRGNLYVAIQKLKTIALQNPWLYQKGMKLRTYLLSK
jgi:CelD/BcsL family acetyltransferase involved in cellulose biosynthesis